MLWPNVYVLIAKTFAFFSSCLIFLEEQIDNSHEWFWVSRRASAVGWLSLFWSSPRSEFQHFKSKNIAQSEVTIKGIYIQSLGHLYPENRKMLIFSWYIASKCYLHQYRMSMNMDWLILYSLTFGFWCLSWQISCSGWVLFSKSLYGGKRDTLTEFGNNFMLKLVSEIFFKAIVSIQ